MQSMGFNLELNFLSPAFGLLMERSLKPVRWPLDEAYRYLQHWIAANPKSLLQHVQRINLAILSQETDKVHSALLDLYLALGKNGKEIRLEMLSLARPFLSEEQLSFYLERSLEGIIPTEAHPKAPYSVLTQGIEGEFDLLLNNNSKQDDKAWSELSWNTIIDLLK